MVALRQLMAKYGPADDDDAAMRAQLGLFGEVQSLQKEAELRWRASFASHAQAEKVVARLTQKDARDEGFSIWQPGAWACFPFFNGRPYGGRGWTTLETGVGTELLARSVFFPRLKAALDALPPKFIEIDGEEPTPVNFEPTAEGAGPRIERVKAAIEGAFFTGKGDKPVVVGMFSDFVVHIGNAMAYSGEVQEQTYEGERNAAGEYEGHGTMRWATGNVYEGQWRGGMQEGRGTYRYDDGSVYEGEYKQGEKEGRGTYRFANGNVYEGEYKQDEREGRGTYRYADGDVEVSCYKADERVGEGAMWSPDRQRAWRLWEGIPVEEIPSSAAHAIAEKLGKPCPDP